MLVGHYDVTTIDGGKYLIASCEVTIKTQKGNTTGMTRHLFRAHSEMYNQLEEMKQKDNESNFDDGAIEINQNVNPKHFQKMDLSKALFSETGAGKTEVEEIKICKICFDGEDGECA